MALERPGYASAGAENGRLALVAELAAIAARDEQALRRFFDLTCGKVFGLLLRTLGDHAAAEDVLQEVYLTVWLKASTFDETRASPITWLVTIARNRAIDRRRSMARQDSHVDLDGVDIADVSTPPHSVLEGADRASRLQPCLATLDEVSREAIRSAFFDGLTYEQLAVRHGVPLGTMKSRIRRGLMRLRTCLGHD